MLSMGDDDSENGQSPLSPLSLVAHAHPLSPWEKYHVSRKWRERGEVREKKGLFYIKPATFCKWTYHGLLRINPPLTLEATLA